LVRIGIDGIHISFDGATKETYETIKKGCNYEITISNIRYLLTKRGSKPIPEICFRYVITKINVHEMPSFIDMIHEHFGEFDIGHIEFVGLLHFPEIAHLFVESVPQDIMEDVYARAKKYGYTVRFAHPGRDLATTRYCTAWSEPYIMLGGYVLSCCAVLMSNRRPELREMAYGNIYDIPFTTIWESDRYKECRRIIPREDQPLPRMCDGCRAFNTYWRKEIHGIYEYRTIHN